MRRPGTTIRERLLYGGLTDSIYREIRPLLNEENHYLLVWISLAASLIGSLMIILTLAGFIRIGAINAYIEVTVCSFMIFLYTVLVVSRHKTQVTVLFYAEITVLLFYAILIGTVFTETPEAFSVTFSAVICIVPFLMIGPPMPIMILMGLADIAVILITPVFKTPQATSMDILNALVFTLIACAGQLVVSTRSMHRITNDNFIARDHDIDGTTGLLNGNAFRLMAEMYLVQRLKGEEGAVILLRIAPSENRTVHQKHSSNIAKVIRMETTRHEFSSRIHPCVFAVFCRECSRHDAELRCEQIVRSAQSFMNEQIMQTAVITTEPDDDYASLVQRGNREIGLKSYAET